MCHAVNLQLTSMHRSSPTSTRLASLEWSLLDGLVALVLETCVSLRAHWRTPDMSFCFQLPRRKSSQGNLKKPRASVAAVPLPSPGVTASTSAEVRESPQAVKKQESAALDVEDLEDELSDVPFNKPIKFVSDVSTRGNLI